MYILGYILWFSSIIYTGYICIFEFITFYRSYSSTINIKLNNIYTIDSTYILQE